MIKLLLGDSADILKTLADNSVDSVVSDPPSAIGFMGKSWDSDRGGRTQWIKWLSSIFIEVHRVLKPGGHCLVWALPRTSHWTGTALEDAGFEVRDCVYHVFGSGFPKSMNIGKKIDEIQGTERIKLSERGGAIQKGSINWQGEDRKGGTGSGYKEKFIDSKGTSEFEGWGTALKPAVECWWLVRKPLSEKTVAENCLKWGTGGINIDGCRVETDEQITNHSRGSESAISKGKYGDSTEQKTHQTEGQQIGRWPSQLIHDGSEEVLSYFPNAGGQQGDLTNHTRVIKSPNGIYGTQPPRFDAIAREENDKSAARFFYCSKPSQAERNFGCDGLEQKFDSSRPWCTEESDRGRIATRMVSRTGKNNHPTVKSIKLMSYLCKLITPKGGIILDCFMGSGTTGCAAKINGFSFIGIEKEEPSYNIAQARIKAYTAGKVTPPKVKKVTEPKVETTTGTVQNTLFE
jgi:site-specific DNA-methyltransferase (adenine-specific)